MNNQMNNQNQPTTSEQPPVQPAKKPKPKWLVPVIIGIGIIVLGFSVYGAYLLLKPTPSEENPPATEDQFKDWKTYRNEEYGFEVKYPGDWSIEETKGFIKAIQTDKEMSLTFYKVDRAKTLYIPCLDQPAIGIICEAKESIRIGDVDTIKYIYPSSATNLDVKAFYIPIERGYHYIEGWPEIEKLHYYIKGEYFSNLTEEELDKIKNILASLKFINPKFSKEDVKKEICTGQPVLVKLSFKYNDAANKVFLEEGDKLKPLTPEDWDAGNYRWPCVDRYYMEEDIPEEIINKLPESDFLTKAQTDIEDWTTYYNKDLGIAFRYPGGAWYQFLDNLNILIEYKLGSIHSQIPYTYIRKYPDGSKEETTIPVSGPLSVWVNICRTCGADWGPIDSIESIDVAGQKTIFITRGKDFEPNRKAYYTVKILGESYDFYPKYIPSQLSSLDWTEEYSESVFATILSTFKFIE